MAETSAVPRRSLESATGFVLAGGQSSRMGTDKALVLFAGIPLIQIAMQTVGASGIPVQIAGARSDLSRFAPIVQDTWLDLGPMAGIHAALSASTSDWNLFLPVDLPLMPSSLLSCLIERARLTGAPVTATTLNGQMQPFPVVLSRSVLPMIESRLKEGQISPRQTSCQRAWQAIPADLESELDSPSVEILAQCGRIGHPLGIPPVFWFQSANTPGDLETLRLSLNLRGLNPRGLDRLSLDRFRTNPVHAAPRFE